jgi:hypothetical protein
MYRRTVRGDNRMPSFARSSFTPIPDNGLNVDIRMKISRLAAARLVSGGHLFSSAGQLSTTVIGVDNVSSRRPATKNR